MRFVAVPAALVLVVGAAVSATAPRHGQAPATPPTVRWSPERPRQGQLFVVRVELPEGGEAATVTGRAAGEELHFVRTPDGGWESPAPVPVDATGSLAVTVTVTSAGNGEQRAEADVPVASGTFTHEKLTVAPEFGSPLDSAAAARLARDQAKAAEVSRQAHRTARLWTDVVRLPRNARVTSEFGGGREFNGQISSRHMGLDLDGDPGDTVRAATRGVVALVDSFLLAGNIVYLNHGGGLLSGYFHLSEQLVAVGDTVEAGTPIGLVGATGRVTGPHLHWVVRYGRTSVDPASLVTMPERWKALSGEAPSGG